MFASLTRILPLAALSVGVAWAEPPDGAVAAPALGAAPAAVPADPAPVAQDPRPDVIPALLPGAPVVDLLAPRPNDPTGASGLLAAGPDTGEGAAAVPKMQPYTVTETQVPVFRERDVYTDKGMIALSMKRHPGLQFGNAFDLNKRAAHELFLADDWRSTVRDYLEMARTMADGGDPAESRMILSEVNDEDMEMRAEGNDDAGLPAFNRLQVGQLDNDSKLLQTPERPLDVSFVRVKW